MSTEFRALLSEHLAASRERQELAQGLVGGRAYAVDLLAQTIAFEGGPRVAAHILGSASSEDGSWYWAWGNPGLGLPDEHLDLSRRVAAFGDELGVAELTAPRLAVDELITVHTLGAVATGVLDADAYFIAENGPLAVLLALQSDLLELPPLDGSAISLTVLGAVGDHDLPHGPLIDSYLRRRGAQLQLVGNRWEILVGSGERLIIHFDDAGRCVNIERPAVRIATGVLVVARVKGGWRDRGRRYRVLVDGAEQATLKLTQSATLELPVGAHTVQMVLDELSSRTLPVLIRAGETVILTAEPSGTARDTRRALESPETYITLRPAD